MLNAFVAADVVHAAVTADPLSFWDQVARFQTLIAGVLALGGALLAFIGIVRQVRTSERNMEMQLRARREAEVQQQHLDQQALKRALLAEFQAIKTRLEFRTNLASEYIKGEPDSDERFPSAILDSFQIEEPLIYTQAINRLGSLSPDLVARAVEVSHELAECRVYSDFITKSSAHTDVSSLTQMAENWRLTLKVVDKAIEAFTELED